VDLQQYIRMKVSAWVAMEEFVLPNIQDAVSFMVTEAGEALDQCLRQKAYVRNNPQDPDLDLLKEEIGDTVFMAMVTAIVMDFNLEEQVVKKLGSMTDKKLASYRKRMGQDGE